MSRDLQERFTFGWPEHRCLDVVGYDDTEKMHHLIDKPVPCFYCYEGVAYNSGTKHTPNKILLNLKNAIGEVHATVSTLISPISNPPSRTNWLSPLAKSFQKAGYHTTFIQSYYILYFNSYKLSVTRVKLSVVPQTYISCPKGQHFGWKSWLKLNFISNCYFGDCLFEQIRQSWKYISLASWMCFHHGSAKWQI